MTLVKSFHGADLSCLTVNTRTSKCLVSIFIVVRLAGAIRSTYWCSSCVFMYVHVTHALVGAMSRALIKMFQIAMTTCSNGSFSRVLASYCRFDSRPGHVSPGTSSLGWRWPWSSLFITSIYEYLCEWQHTRVSLMQEFSLYNLQD